MSKLTHLCLGACGILVLVGGLVWMPINATAAPGDPQNGPSRPTVSSYGNNERYGNEAQGRDEYGRDEYGRENNGSKEYGRGEYGNSSNGEYGNSGNGEYGNSGNGEYGNSSNGEYGNSGNGEYGNSNSCEDYHTIALGENLTTIAASYGLSVEQLAHKNHIEDTNLIVENQTLCIPAHDANSYGDRGAYENGNDEQGNGYGQQENGNGEQENGNRPYMVPGKSYDPSYFENEGNGNGNGYDEQGNSYGPRQEGYGQQENGNGEQGNGYGRQENGNGEQENGNRPYMIPGRSYDPSYFENQGNGNGNGYGEQGNSYGPRREGYGWQENGNGD